MKVAVQRAIELDQERALEKARKLAREYQQDVLARRRAGDNGSVRAEYHAQAPKLDAYGVLIDAGHTPNEAIAIFRKLLAELGPEVSS